MRVTFGINNYNRLFYLKSCAESLMESVSDHSDIEFICVDDNSEEPGTKEYLDALREKGWKVINQQDHRSGEKGKIGKNDVDHISAFGEALNIIFQESTGEIIFPLQGDCQFIRKNWLKDYISLFQENDDVGSVLIDCQRKIRLNAASFVKVSVNDSMFCLDSTRSNVNGAGDCGYRRSVIAAVGGWETPQQGGNAEVNLSEKIENKFSGKMKTYLPWIPVCVGIFTDPRGTNARVRGNKRFGKYWSVKNDQYYEWVDVSQLEESNNRPYSIEELARPIEWEAPIDDFGDWKKNPIDISAASREDYEIIYEIEERVEVDDDHIQEWLLD